MNRLAADPGDVIQEWAERHLGHWQAAQRHLNRSGRVRMVIVSVAEVCDLSVPASTFLFWDYHVVMRLIPATVKTLCLAESRAGQFLALAIWNDDDQRSWARFCWLPIAHHNDELPAVITELGEPDHALSPMDQ